VFYNVNCIIYWLQCGWLRHKCDTKNAGDSLAFFFHSTVVRKLLRNGVGMEFDRVLFRLQSR
ncbi:hypothetical protein ACJX0J_037003, partial [Zea mays]